MEVLSKLLSGLKVKYKPRSIVKGKCFCYEKLFINIVSKAICHHKLVFYENNKRQVEYSLLQNLADEFLKLKDIKCAFAAVKIITDKYDRNTNLFFLVKKIDAELIRNLNTEVLFGLVNQISHSDLKNRSYVHIISHLIEKYEFTKSFQTADQIDDIKLKNRALALIAFKYSEQMKFDITANVLERIEGTAFRLEAAKNIIFPYLLKGKCNDAVHILEGILPNDNNNKRAYCCFLALKKALNKSHLGKDEIFKLVDQLPRYYFCQPNYGVLKFLLSLADHRFSFEHCEHIYFLFVDRLIANIEDPEHRNQVCFQLMKQLSFKQMYSLAYGVAKKITCSTVRNNALIEFVNDSPRSVCSFRNHSVFLELICLIEDVSQIDNWIQLFSNDLCKVYCYQFQNSESVDTQSNNSRFDEIFADVLKTIQNLSKRWMADQLLLTISTKFCNRNYVDKSLEVARMLSNSEKRVNLYYSISKDLVNVRVVNSYTPFSDIKFFNISKFLSAMLYEFDTCGMHSNKRFKVNESKYLETNVSPAYEQVVGFVKVILNKIFNKAGLDDLRYVGNTINREIVYECIRDIEDEYFKYLPF